MDPESITISTGTSPDTTSYRFIVVAQKFVSFFFVRVCFHVRFDRRLRSFLGTVLVPHLDYHSDSRRLTSDRKTSRLVTPITLAVHRWTVSITDVVPGLPAPKALLFGCWPLVSHVVDTSFECTIGFPLILSAPLWTVWCIFTNVIISSMVNSSSSNFICNTTSYSFIFDCHRAAFCPFQKDAWLTVINGPNSSLPMGTA